MRPLGLWLASLTFLALAAPRPAHACGVGTGAGGGVSSCSLAEHDGHVEAPWRLGATTTYTSTALHFSSDHHADAERTSFLGTLEYRVTRRLTLLTGFGALSGGTLVTDGSPRGGSHAAQTPEGRLVTYDMQTGPLFALGASYRIVDPRKSGDPFLVFGGQLSYVASSTRPTWSAAGETPYYAGDLRLGMTLGILLFDRVSPYATGRVFGGPIYWRIQGEKVQGTDVHKYQLGAGLVVALGGKRGPHLDAFFEGIPLGEQGLTGGFGLSF